MAVQKANYIHRDYEVDGVSASGFHQVIPREERVWGTWVEGAINAGLSNGGLIYDTKANMDADLDHPANASAWVVSDGANNGIYRKSGASGSGSWTKIADLPYSVVYAQNDGSGTGDAVVATSSTPIATTAYSQLISVPFTASNTGAMTLSINGETPRPLVTNTGEPIPAGYVSAGMSALVQIDGAGNYRLFSYGDAAAVQAVVENLLLQAEAARDAAQAAQPQAFPVDRTALAALPDTTANAYLKEAGYQGYFEQVDATTTENAALLAADTVGGEIKVSSGNSSLAYLRQRKYGDMMKSSEFGQDIAVALAVAGEQAKRFGLQHRVDVYVNQAGTLALSKGLIVPTGVNLISDKNLVLDASSIAAADTIATATGLSGSGGVIMDVRPTEKTSLTGLYAALPSFQPIAVGDIAVTYDSAHGLVEGQVVTWYDTTDSSWSLARPDYRLGMRRRVVGVDGLKIYLDKPAFDDFTSSATLKAYKQSMLSGGRFGGFKIDLEGSALTASLGVLLTGLDERSEISDIVVNAASYGGVHFNQCLDLKPSRIRGGVMIQDTSSGSYYPIGICNSTGVVVRDSEGAGDWHSLAMIGMGGANLSPGALINEDCWFEDCKAYNSGNREIGAIEMHGNSDRCGFRDCDASGAVLGGRDPTLEGGRLVNATGDTSNPATGSLVYFGEAHSGRFAVLGTIMRSVKNTGSSLSTGGAIRGLFAHEAKGEVFVDMQDVFMDAPQEQLPIVLGTTIAGDVAISVSFDGHVNVPAASRLITMQYNNVSAVQTEASYFRIERAAGLKAGCAWAVWSQTGGAPITTFSEVKFPKQTVKGVTSGVAAASELMAPINWDHAFPTGYTPTAVPTLQSYGLGAKATIVNSVVTTSAARPQVSTGDGTNMAAVATPVSVEGW